MKKTRFFLSLVLISAVLGVNMIFPIEIMAASSALSGAAHVDSNHDGMIDRIKVTFTDNIMTCNFEAGDWVLFSGTSGITGPTGILNGAGVAADCDGSTDFFYLVVSGNAGMTGYSGTYVPAELNYDNQGTLYSILAVGSIPVLDSPVYVVGDNASPVVLSTVPTAGTTGVSVTTSIVRVTFSEPMSTGATSMSVSAGSWGPPVWSDSNKTLTRSRLLALPYDTNITVTVIGEDMGGYLVSTGASPAVVNPWSFKTTTDPALTVSASQSTVSASPASVVANGSFISVVTATIKNSSGSPLSGRVVTLSSTRGAIDTIMSMTGTTGSDGKAYFQVYSNTAGSSIFTATTGSTVIAETATVTFTSATPTPGPVSASRSSVYVTPSSVIADSSSYATASVTVRDASDNPLSGKTVVLTSSRGGMDTVSSISGGSITNSSGQATLQVRSGTAGTAVFSATVDGTTITQTATVTFTAVTPPGGLVYGDLFKESGSTAVYYYGTDGKRHVFPTQAIYFSWYSGFSGIKTVSHGTVTSAPLGGNVIAKPGTYLVQFVSMDTPFRVLDPKIYGLEANGQLRWVTSGSAASALYGADWEKKIIAVPEVFRTNYLEGGTNINSASDYNKASTEALARTISDTIR